jgi:hypothetical protein
MGWGGFGRLAPLSLFIAFALVAIAGGAAYQIESRHRPTYVAFSAVMLDEPLAIAASQDLGVVDKLARLRYKYVGLLRSDDVVTDAAKRAGLSPAAISASTVGRIDGGSLLMFVGGQGFDRRTVVRVANALTAALASYITREQSIAAIAPVDRLSLLVVAPSRGASQILPTKRQKLVAAGGAALVTFVLAAAALDIIRRRES